ncbi:hypothetical protein [Microbulbifer sediminum]|uniref:hypothetical protein n=1 Tax=Microbulbifer sediminum TaxID=2904250 RepID=UPI001F18E2DA|nr:hypothetical protein [Microbulbifer sediminum]
MATELGEYVSTDYDGIGELLVEWHINQAPVLYFSGANLLDRERHARSFVCRKTGVNLSYS